MISKRYICDVEIVGDLDEVAAKELPESTHKIAMHMKCYAHTHIHVYIYIYMHI